MNFDVGVEEESSSAAMDGNGSDNVMVLNVRALDMMIIPCNQFLRWIGVVIVVDNIKVVTRSDRCKFMFRMFLCCDTAPTITTDDEEEDGRGCRWPALMVSATKALVMPIKCCCSSSSKRTTDRTRERQHRPANMTRMLMFSVAICVDAGGRRKMLLL